MPLHWMKLAKFIRSLRVALMLLVMLVVGGGTGCDPASAAAASLGAKLAGRFLAQIGVIEPCAGNNLLVFLNFNIIDEVTSAIKDLRPNQDDMDKANRDVVRCDLKGTGAAEGVSDQSFELRNVELTSRDGLDNGSSVSSGFYSGKATVTQTIEVDGKKEIMEFVLKDGTVFRRQ